MATQDHPAIAQGLAFCRENSLWPGGEQPSFIGGVYKAPDEDAAKLEKYIDSLPESGAWSGGFFQYIMGRIVWERNQDRVKT